MERLLNKLYIPFNINYQITFKQYHIFNFKIEHKNLRSHIFNEYIFGGSIIKVLYYEYILFIQMMSNNKTFTNIIKPYERKVYNSLKFTSALHHLANNINNRQQNIAIVMGKYVYIEKGLIIEPTIRDDVKIYNIFRNIKKSKNIVKYTT